MGGSNAACRINAVASRVPQRVIPGTSSSMLVSRLSKRFKSLSAACENSGCAVTINRFSILQSSQKPSTYKCSLWIKLLLEPLHHMKVCAWLSPYTNTSFQLDRAAFDDQATTSFLCMSAQFGPSLSHATHCIPWPQF